MEGNFKLAEPIKRQQKFLIDLYFQGLFQYLSGRIEVFFTYKKDKLLQEKFTNWLYIIRFKSLDN